MRADRLSCLGAPCPVPLHHRATQAQMIKGLYLSLDERRGSGHDLKPARCQRITVSGRTITSASYILGNSRQTPPNISLSIEMKRGLLGRVRRSTLICCLKTRTSASSATRDRSRSITIPKISLHKSNIGQQHRPIPDQPPAGWRLRQGHPLGIGSTVFRLSQKMKGCPIMPHVICLDGSQVVMSAPTHCTLALRASSLAFDVASDFSEKSRMVTAVKARIQERVDRARRAAANIND